MIRGSMMLIAFLAIMLGIACAQSTAFMNGCSAYKCKRKCLNDYVLATPGDNGFQFDVEGLIDNSKYVPEKTYKG